MGAREKLIASSRLVDFDFKSPSFIVRKSDRETLRRDENGQINDELVNRRAVQMTISEIINSAFPTDPRTGQGGMNRVDGKIWAAWLELLDDDVDQIVQMPLTQVEWLKKHLINDDLKIRPAFVQWREALSEYLEVLCKEIPEPASS